MSSSDDKERKTEPPPEEKKEDPLGKKDDEYCNCCSCLDDFALKLNGYIEAGFSAVGYIIGTWPYVAIGLVLLFLGLCCFGYIFVSIETQLFNLWTPTDAPVFAEQEFIKYYWGDKDYGLSLITGYAKAGEDTNILTPKYMDEWYQMHLDFATKLPTKDYRYTAADNSRQTVTFSYFAENYEEPPSLPALSAMAKQGLGPTKYASEVIPLCRAISGSPAEGQFQMPCYIATIFDCFSEGGYFFPYEDYLKHTQLSSFIPANLYTYARDSYKGKDTIQLGDVLGPSCAGLTGTTWPPNFIYGGDTRINSSDEQSTLLEVQSFQLAAFMDSAHNIARKMKIARGECLYTETYGIACPDVTEKEESKAQQFLDEWSLDYIAWLKDYAQQLRDDDTKLFNLVYWTPRTIGDLLREASSADYGLLVLAYAIMIVFASLTAINFDSWFLSRSEASFAGVLFVLFSVVATIGLGSFLQVPLSPNIVQVLPFIALGFGVDDMFILLFSFKFRYRLSVAEMISETVRIAGSSVALTSLANFLGFLIGTTMVLPDVSRFAAFGAVVVLLNFIALIFGFTGVLALVARRMKHGYRDWSFLFCWTDCTHEANANRDEKPSSQADSLFDPLFDWLTKTYTRVVMIVIFITLIIIGIVGCTQMAPGLPLEDIVPSTSYASDFLRIREKYYSSYPLSLYTDADSKGNLQPIDWPNKFEEWLEATQDVYSIPGDNVYSDPDVHSFWAWNMQKYLVTKYEETLTGRYALGEVFDVAAALSDETVYQAWMCHGDVWTYCPTIGRVYSYGSDLFNCLLVNYQLNNLETDCGAWVEMVYVANTADSRAVAKQIYITSYEEDSSITVGGLYVRPSTNDIKVFIKQPDEDGYIYQTQCGLDLCEWYLLDAAFNILYVGQATDTDTEAPSQGGWRDGTSGDIVAITHVYYDFGVQYYGNVRDESVFMAGDYTPSNVFTFNNVFESSQLSSTNTCIQWEVMRLLMSDSDAFGRVSMSESVHTSNANDVLCDAILESSELCVSIRDESDLGSVYCGFEERLATKSLWYTGAANGSYQIMSTPDNVGTDRELEVSSSIFDNCEDPSLWTATSGNEITLNYTYNYVVPCTDSANDNSNYFGGFANECSATPQEISVECTALTDCGSDLRVCYNDYEEIGVLDAACLGLVGSYDGAFRNGDSDAYELADIVAKCSFKYYTHVSDCCREAINSQILSLPQYTCKSILFSFGSDPFNLAYGDSLQSVCQATDKCQFNGTTCSEVPTNRVFDDCYRLISGVDPDADCSLETLNISDTQIRRGEQDAFRTCMSSAVTQSFPGTYGALLSSGSDKCQSVFNSQSVTYPNCLYPVDSFYDVDASKYDYSMCSDYSFNVCGSQFNDTDAQLNCLLDNIASITAGCCKLCIEQIASESHSFTNECEADTQSFCVSFGITSAGSAIAAATAGITATHPVTQATIYPGELCMAAILQNTASLRPKCTAAIGACEATSDGWPTTAMGEPAAIDCPTGFTGQQHRVCGADAVVPAKWSSTIDTDACVALTCPEIESEYDQYWPGDVSAGSVYKIYGDEQISSALKGSLDCNGVFFLRRACRLNPYNSSQAIWDEPLLECKPLMSLWDDNVQQNTVCDFITEQVTQNLAEYVAPLLATTKSANLIGGIVWSIFDEQENGGVTTDRDTHILISQSYCAIALSNCAAFTYDNAFQITYFFDYCGATLNSQQLRTDVIAPIASSKAYAFGALDFVAAGASLELGRSVTKDDLTQWSFYPDPIFAEFAPTVSRNLSTFADRHTTYISPLTRAEFIAWYCTSASEDESVTSPSQAWTAEGIPHASCFNNVLWLFFSDPTGTGAIKRDSIYFVDPTQVSNETGYDNVFIVSTSNTVMIRGIDDDEAAVDFIIALRKRLDSWSADDELYAIPSGLIITLFSQYVGVDAYLVSNLIYVSIAIVCCGLIFLLNPIAVAVAVLCNTAMVIEVYGFSHWFGLRVNGVLVLNIVIAVALTMEFTAHIGRAFVLSTVTIRDRKESIALPFSDAGQIRMKKTLREMFAPVSLGALTTLIGVAPIAGAQFPYFRQYYFTLYVMIVAAGWMNGVIFQTTILSFMPPKPFIKKEGRKPNRPVQIQSAGDSVHEPLVQQQQNSNKSKKTETNPIALQVRTELVKKKHTRNTSDAP